MLTILVCDASKYMQQTTLTDDTFYAVLNSTNCCHTEARRLRAKFWPDCAIPDTSMKFDTVVDHD